MTIQDSQDGYHSDSDNITCTDRAFNKDDLRNQSLPAILEKMPSLDLSGVKIVFERPISLQRTFGGDDSASPKLTEVSRTILKSPPTVLRDRSKGSSSSSEELLSQSRTRDIIRRVPVSLEDLSKSKLDMNGYQSRRQIKRSRSKSFNKSFVSLLECDIKGSHTQQINDRFVDEYIQANVSKKIDVFMNGVNDFSTISSQELEECCPLLARELFTHLCRKDELYLFVNRNLLRFKMIVGSVLEKIGRKYRSEWVDELVETLECMLGSESFSTGKYTLNESLKNSLSFFNEFLDNHVKTPSARSLLLRAIHNDEDEAVKTVKRLAYWSSHEAYCELTSMVRHSMEMYLNHQNVQKKVTQFKEDSFMSAASIENVDFEQVARSYIMHNKRNYNVLKINGRDVSDVGLSGTSKECQKQFFESFFKILYEEGYSVRVDDEYVTEQVALFLEFKPFYGSEILFAGSNNAWAICNIKFRSLYPLLFGSTYKTRMNQGSECYIQVESKEKFSLQINRTYSTFPQPPEVNSTDSWAIDPSRRLCTIHLTWQIDCNAKDEWSYSISTPSVRRKKATDDEWKELNDILLAPESVEGSINELPTNSQLLEAFKMMA
jgi:hypothetical protein